jgi:ABC-2 type transport system ATP-binding protein
MKEDHGMNVVLCSHLLRDVEEVCDEAVILKDGQIVHHADLEAERSRTSASLNWRSGDDRTRPRRSAKWVSNPFARPPAAGAWCCRLASRSTRCGASSPRSICGFTKLTHRRDTLEEIFLKAVGHLPSGAAAAPEQPEEVAADGRL